MKTSSKIKTFLIIFFIAVFAIIATRHFVGLHFKKKFSVKPPPGVIVEIVKKSSFYKSIEKNEKTILSNLPSICVSLSDNLYEKIMGEKNKGSIKEFKEIAGNDSS